MFAAPSLCDDPPFAVTVFIALLVSHITVLRLLNIRGDKKRCLIFLLVQIIRHLFLAVWDGSPPDRKQEDLAIRRSSANELQNHYLSDLTNISS